MKSISSVMLHLGTPGTLYSAGVAILYFISAVCHSFARIVGHISQSRCFGSTNIVAFVSG
jgi:hypothetical protein